MRRETLKQPPEDMLLVQSIEITDKFGFEKQQQQSQIKPTTKETVFMATDNQAFCINGFGNITSL